MTAMKVEAIVPSEVTNGLMASLKAEVGVLTRALTAASTGVSGTVGAAPSPKRGVSEVGVVVGMAV